MSSSLPPIVAAIAQARDECAARAFSPLHPVLPPSGAELHPKQAAQLAEALKLGKAHEAALLRHARGVQHFLGLSYAELCEEARRIPERLRAIATVDGCDTFDPERLIDVAQRVFGIEVPGKSRQAQLARVLDARYWRRVLWKRIGQEKELLFLKLGRIGKNGRAYCSADAVHVRATQQRAQQRWLKETVLTADIDGEQVELALEAVAKTPRQRLSRLYAFIAAMDRLAVESELEVALVTATLEGPWHPNPGYAKPGHQWNGKTPGEAAHELSARWQRVRNDLDKQGIALSGLWTAEPHRDGCPHRHFWLLYAPEHRHAIFGAFLGHFPGRLKLRGDDESADVMFETKADAVDGVSRPLKRKREGAQVDVSVIEKRKGRTGASYVIKYVAKAIGAEGAFDGADVPASSKRQQRTLQAIDAYRALWGMRGAQFFGIRSCLGLWDELRKMKEPPAEPELLVLWRAARGGDAKGSIEASQQRGDAYAFLKLQGGLAAVGCRAEPEQAGKADADAPPGAPLARVYRVPSLTQYGEQGQRVEGVELVGDGAVLERVSTRTAHWQMKPKKLQGPKPQPKRKGRKAKAAPTKAAPAKTAPADAAGDS